MTFSDENVVKW